MIKFKRKKGELSYYDKMTRSAKMEPKFRLKSVEEIKTFLGENISKVCSFEEKHIHIVNISFDPNMRALREFVRKIRRVANADVLSPRKVQVILPSEKKKVSPEELEKHRSKIRPLTLKRFCFIYQEFSKREKEVSPKLIQEILQCFSENSLRLLPCILLSNINVIHVYPLLNVTYVTFDIFM